MNLRVVLLLTALAIGGCRESANFVQGSDDSQTSVTPMWAYETGKDEMRGQRWWSATIQSSNAPALDFPYEGRTPITLQIVGREGASADDIRPEFVIRNGKFDCSLYGSSARSCAITVKIDNSEPEEMRGFVNDCGKAQCLHLVRNLEYSQRNRPEFFALMREATDVTVELPLYKFGSYQYKFHVTGLQWPDASPPQGSKSSG